MGSGWTRMSPHPLQLVPRGRETHTEADTREDKGRGRRDAPAPQGTPRPAANTGSQTRRERPALHASDSWPPELWENKLLLFQPHGSQHLLRRPSRMGGARHTKNGGRGGPWATGAVFAPALRRRKPWRVPGTRREVQVLTGELSWMLVTGKGAGGGH